MAKWNGKAMSIVRLYWTVAGGLVVPFGAMHYFTPYRSAPEHF